MIELNGKYATAKVYADELEQSAIGQIVGLCNREVMKDANIRIMPDVHSGIGCVIGTTLVIRENRVIPNLVGVDIGCGMLTVHLKDKRLELPKLDSVINKNVPSGFSVRNKTHRFLDRADLDELLCKRHINMERAELGLGTLGGGNHFIEVARASDDSLYIIIHSGSRHLGLQIAKHYQELAIKELKKAGKISDSERIFAYCEGELFDAYIHDMTIAQQYADLNREAIADEIVKGMKLTVDEKFTTVHNYISKAENGDLILRKGAVSAEKDEVLLIPINMRDGSLLCKGKGNPDWNYSAPHGAGRLMSRSDAKNSFSVNEFKATMKEAGIFSTSVSKDTLDECPMAYKPMQSILSQIGDTVDVFETLKPIYNFKSGKED